MDEVGTLLLLLLPLTFDPLLDDCKMLLIPFMLRNEGCEERAIGPMIVSRRKGGTHVWAEMKKAADFVPPTMVSEGSHLSPLNTC